VKLAIVTRGFPPDVTTGRETVAYNLWRQAVALDDVKLVCGCRRNSSSLPCDATLINQSSSSRTVNYARFFVQSALAIKNIRPDVVLSNSIELGPVSCPSVAIVHDLNFGIPDTRRGRRYIRLTTIRQRLRHFSRIVAVSRTTAKRLSEAGVSESKITVIPNGVDLDHYTPGYRPENTQFTISYPARIVRGKGQHVALDAFRQMDREMRQTMKLVFAGRAEDKSYLSELQSSAQGLPVEIHTDVSDMLPFYRNADLVIFPTIMEEGFGFTAAEAMACGKPVIYSDYPAIREATGNTGVPVPPGAPAALAEAICMLFAEPARRTFISSSGYDYARNHYAWKNVYSEYRRLLIALAGKQHQ